MTAIKYGKYQHYKGRFYEVIGIARHSETLEEWLFIGRFITQKSLAKTLCG